LELATPRCPPRRRLSRPSRRALTLLTHSRRRRQPHSSKQERSPQNADGRFGCRAGRRTVNFTKVGLHVDLDREGNFVQHVGGLVNPTPLVPGAWKDLLDGLPEAERAVADRQVGGDLEPTLLDVDEEFAPALCALPHPCLEADQFL